MTAIYLEQYLDSIENLPIELKSNFAKMRELDETYLAAQKSVEDKTSRLMKSIKKLSGKERTDQKKEITAIHKKCFGICDDKVQIAVDTYELVDKHIRRLDQELARFEGELKQMQLEAKGKPTISENEKVEKKKRRTDSGESQPNKQKNDKSICTPSHMISGLLPGIISGSADVLDMPVDPNEPTYCICHQVSYGEMIGCDNPDCPIEWFHFPCVSLTTKPKGKWFCPRCISEKKKKP